MQTSAHRAKRSLAAALAGTGKTHLTTQPDGTVDSTGQRVTALDRLLLDIVAEVRANLDRWNTPVPGPGYGQYGDRVTAAVARLQALCDCYELLTERAGAEALHLAAVTVAEQASRKHQQALSSWLERHAPALPEERQLRDWPLTTFTVAEDRSLARLRRRSPQLEDVTFTDAPDLSMVGTIAAFDPDRHDRAVATLVGRLHTARVAGADTLLVGNKRLVGLGLDRNEAWSADHDSDTGEAYTLLRPRYADVLHLDRYGCAAAPEHLLWERDGERRRRL